MEGICNGKIIGDKIHKIKKNQWLHILTNSLQFHGLETLNDLYGTPLELVQGVHNCTVHWVYLPLAMVLGPISVKKYLTLAKAYPGLLQMGMMDGYFMEQYLSLW